MLFGERWMDVLRAAAKPTTRSEAEGRVFSDHGRPGRHACNVEAEAEHEQDIQGHVQPVAEQQKIERAFRILDTEQPSENHHVRQCGGGGQKTNLQVNTKPLALPVPSVQKPSWRPPVTGLVRRIRMIATTDGEHQSAEESRLEFEVVAGAVSLCDQTRRAHAERHDRVVKRAEGACAEGNRAKMMRAPADDRPRRRRPSRATAR